MTKTVTQCPKCSTSFRVTEKQLQAAKGKVRCGSCLHVFLAADHWLPEAGSPAAPAPTAAAPAASAAQAKPSAPPAATAPAEGSAFRFDQAAIDSSSAANMLTRHDMPALRAIESLALDTQVGMAVVGSSDPDAEIPEDEEGMVFMDDLDVLEEDIGDDVLFNDDAGIEDGSFNDTQEAEAVNSPATMDTGFSEAFLNVTGGKKVENQFNTQFSTAFQETIDEESVDMNLAADESWAKDLLEDTSAEEPHIDPHAPPVNSRTKTGTTEPFSDPMAETVKSRPGDRDRPRQRTTFTSAGEMADEGSYVAHHQHEAMRDLALQESAHESDFLSQFERGRQRRSGIDTAELLSQLKWGGLCLLAVLIMVVQYTAHNFDTLAHNQGYRPVLAAVCSIAGCKMPDAVDWKAIKATNLVVRTHASIGKVLVVDAMLVNTSRYEQPFPQLEIYFSDIDDFPVASRRFMPQEYLRGELAGKKLMPSGQQIHLSLDVLDPGAKAVNYRAEVAPL